MQQSAGTDCNPMVLCINDLGQPGDWYLKLELLSPFTAAHWKG